MYFEEDLKKRRRTNPHGQWKVRRGAFPFEANVESIKPISRPQDMDFVIRLEHIRLRRQIARWVGTISLIRINSKRRIGLLGKSLSKRKSSRKPPLRWIWTKNNMKLLKVLNVKTSMLSWMFWANLRSQSINCKIIINTRLQEKGLRIAQHQFSKAFCYRDVLIEWKGGNYTNYLVCCL